MFKNDLRKKNIIRNLIYLVGFVGFVYWIRLLQMNLSTVSRGDFLWEMWHIGPSVERGDWVSVLGLIFKIFGGHIAAYTRVAQIFNYVVFDYSGVFTKYSNIFAHVLMGIAMFSFSKKVEGITLKGAIVFLWGIAYFINPISSANIGWIDSNISYYAPNILLLFFLPTATKWFLQPRWSAKTWFKIALFCIAIIFGCGAGWGIIPLVLVAWLISSEKINRLRQKYGWKSYLALGAIGLIVLYVLKEFILFFTLKYSREFYLDDLYRAFGKIGENLPFLFKYTMGVFALPITEAPMTQTWGWGVLVFLIWVVTVTAIVLTGKLKQNFNYFLMTLFGLFVMVLVGFGRWEIAASRQSFNVPVYYGILILPFYLGFPFLIFAALENKLNQLLRKSIGAVFIAFTLSFAITNNVLYAKNFAGIKEYYEAARFGTQNWNPVMQTRLSGALSFNVEYLFGVLPGLKKYGKDKALTEPFIDDPALWAKQHGFTVQSFEKYKEPSYTVKCEGFKDVIGFSEDLRGGFSNPPRNPEIKFVRAFGIILSPENCNEIPDFVFMADGKGKILCVSRPGMRTWDIDSQYHERLVNKSHGIIDFSCPLDKGYKDQLPYQLFAFFKDRQIIRIGEARK